MIRDRLRRSHIRLACVALAAVSACAAGTAAAADAAPPTQPGVRVLYGVVARAQPNAHSRVVAHVRSWTPLTLSGTVLPVVSPEVSSAGAKWVRVQLPFRPNGLTGWIPSRATKPVEIPWRIDVSLARRRVTVYESGQAVRSFRAVIGARSTPTPRGHFFVVERVKLHTSWAHGLWALALSAHSNVLKRFDGGDGQVALHARGSLVEPLGSAASHGCVRLANGDIAWLAHHVGNGTPVDIH